MIRFESIGSRAILSLVKPGERAFSERLVDLPMAYGRFKVGLHSAIRVDQALLRAKKAGWVWGLTGTHDLFKARRCRIDAGRLFHVRIVHVIDLPLPDRLVLTPRRPRHPLPGEDKEQARISFAPSIGQAAVALDFDVDYRYTSPDVREDYRLVIYTNAVPVHARIPPLGWVPVAYLTGEVWVKKSTLVVRVGEIAPKDWEGLLTQLVTARRMRQETEPYDAIPPMELVRLNRWIERHVVRT